MLTPVLPPSRGDRDHRVKDTNRQEGSSAATRRWAKYTPTPAQRSFPGVKASYKLGNSFALIALTFLARFVTALSHYEGAVTCLATLLLQSCPAFILLGPASALFTRGRS